jgi:SAM-dependent methyltransferase
VGLKSGLGTLGLLPAARWLRDIAWTIQFWRANASYWWRGAPDGLPIPPASLRIAVAASPDISWFLEAGRRGAASVRGALERAGIDPGELRALLDFGCGCGRVTRHWAGLPAEIHGCDINPRLVSWCRGHLPFGRFEVTSLAPPLPYADGRFDFAYALSVFTHLPEALQHAWMTELRRVLRPGGLLFLTTHGPRYLEQLTPEERAQFETGQLVVRHEERAGSNACGAYHPVGWVRTQLAKGFEIADYVPEGATGNPWQDLYLLRRL